MGPPGGDIAGWFHPATSLAALYGPWGSNRGASTSSESSGVKGRRSRSRSDAVKAPLTLRSGPSCILDLPTAVPFGGGLAASNLVLDFVTPPA